MSASLQAFSQVLRPYQARAFNRVLDWVGEAQPGARLCLAAPTGTGKGTLQLALLRALRAGGLDALLLSPSLEVLRGVVERCGGEPAETEDALAEQARVCYATTPTRLRNAVLAGTSGMPDVILYDEVHHAVEANEVSGTLFAVAPDALWIGFTATPYRGTPEGTRQLRQEWGDPEPILTLHEAVTGGFASLPRCRVVPLLDDDEVTVQGGEFVTKAATKLAATRVDALAALVRDEQAANPLPTVVAVPSTEVCGLLVEALDRVGVDASMIVQHTRQRDRARALERCRAGETVIVQIRVISEGVDLPWLRRLIDARPTLSPVSWIQQLGRIMRPGGVSDYVCTCRNLERHAYLLGSVLPRAAVREAQQAFGGPSKRAGLRSMGLEALKKFKSIPLPLAGGVMGSMYSLSAPTEDGYTELVALLDPQAEKPIVATKRVSFAVTEGADPDWGKWRMLPDLPDGIVGYGTQQRHDRLSDKQKAWWKKAAHHYGLDPQAGDSLKRRQFPALPILKELGLKIGSRV